MKAIVVLLCLVGFTMSFRCHCRPERCFPVLLDCADTTTDICGCCPVCAPGEGEICYFSNGRQCQTGLVCESNYYMSFYGPRMGTCKKPGSHKVLATIGEYCNRHRRCEEGLVCKFKRCQEEIQWWQYDSLF